MTRKDKIQCLLINYLLEHGSISIDLPDRMQVEIGLTKEGKDGKYVSDDYCWVAASRENKSVAIDSYNLGLNFGQENGIILVDDADNEISVSVI